MSEAIMIRYLIRLKKVKGYKLPKLRSTFRPTSQIFSKTKRLVLLRGVTGARASGLAQLTLLVVPMGCGGSKASPPRGRVPLGVLLSEGEEKAAVVSAFKKTAKEFEVVSVERIESYTVRRAYSAKLEQISTANGTSAEAMERAWVFHGTNESTAKFIAQSGFKMGNAPVDLPHGQGIYFARDASNYTSTSYAQPNADGIQHMFLVRAAVGEYCVGKKGQETPDVRPDGRPFDSTVDSVENPSFFVTYDEAQQVPEYLIRFKLGLWSAGVALGSSNLIERSAVVGAFTKTVQGRNILSVERIESPSLRDAYEAKLQAIASANGASSEDTERVWVFSGTDEHVAKLIVQNGFKMAYSTGMAYGQGISFQRDASVSASTSSARPNSDGIQHVFLVRAAVGEYCIGKKGAEAPDARPDGRPFDSTVDSLEDPTTFVTYHDSQQVPEYLIRFKGRGQRV